ncbi:MAG: hypothetical protein ABI760_11260 [Ferruginibacter sp.]
MVGASAKPAILSIFDGLLKASLIFCLVENKISGNEVAVNGTCNLVADWLAAGKQ